MQSFKHTIIEIFEERSGRTGSIDEIHDWYKAAKQNNIVKGKFVYHFNQISHLFYYAHEQYWLK